MRYFKADSYEVVVIGAGHAGCEAGLAAARLGHKTLVLTMSMESVADMPCNPNIGGTGKGHLVREIDALGGEMAINIDKTFIQSRMLNTSKGPAVHSLRVQADKRLYHEEMKKVLENQDNLSLVQDEVIDIEIEDGKVKSVRCKSGADYGAECVIVATGTFLKSLILMGELTYSSGPSGFAPSLLLSDSLEDLGISLRRFKTGTPARVHRDSVDLDKMEVQPGDSELVPFSFMNDPKDVERKQENCYLTYSTGETKKIIQENIHRSPMYSGEEMGIGPRYCPSIEDKIVRFPDRLAHQVFLEPEGLSTKEMYVQGVSSTLPYEVQIKLYQSIEHMEGVQIMRPAHGIEYDCIDPTILKRTLEHKKIKNLYFAGQINGSSGYEEAAAQGLIAGINCHCRLEGLEDFTLDRSEAYIGVLIDDLVTKGTGEPYRMMTSRAEYRLVLRQDNADFRLTEKAYKIGLVTEERYERFRKRLEDFKQELERLENFKINPTRQTNEILESLGTSPIKTGSTMVDLLRRPELTYDNLKALDPYMDEVPSSIKRQVTTEIKYQGYIEKQMIQINQFKKMEGKIIPEDLNYEDIEGLRNEAVEKLSDVRPETLGQASRISGVSPADINVLLIYIELERRRNG